MTHSTLHSAPPDFGADIGKFYSGLEELVEAVGPRITARNEFGVEYDTIGEPYTARAGQGIRVRADEDGQFSALTVEEASFQLMGLLKNKSFGGIGKGLAPYSDVSFHLTTPDNRLNGLSKPLVICTFSMGMDVENAQTRTMTIGQFTKLLETGVFSEVASRRVRLGRFIMRHVLYAAAGGKPRAGSTTRHSLPQSNQ